MLLESPLFIAALILFFVSFLGSNLYEINVSIVPETKIGAEYKLVASN